MGRDPAVWEGEGWESCSRWSLSIFLQALVLASSPSSALSGPLWTLRQELLVLGAQEAWGPGAEISCPLVHLGTGWKRFVSLPDGKAARLDPALSASSSEGSCVVGVQAPFHFVVLHPEGGGLSPGPTLPTSLPSPPPLRAAPFLSHLDTADRGY